MGNLTQKLFIFTVGAALGSVATYFITKAVVERDLKEDHKEELSEYDMEVKDLQRQVRDYEFWELQRAQVMYDRKEGNPLDSSEGDSQEEAQEFEESAPELSEPTEVEVVEEGDEFQLLPAVPPGGFTSVDQLTIVNGAAYLGDDTFLVSHQEYWEDWENYNRRVKFSYFTVDDVLVCHGEKGAPDIVMTEMSMKEQNIRGIYLDCFGVMEGDPNLVCIRNDRDGLYIQIGRRECAFNYKKDPLTQEVVMPKLEDFRGATKKSSAFFSSDPLFKKGSRLK